MRSPLLRELNLFFFQAEAVLATAGSFRNDGANGTLPVLNPAELHQLQVRTGGGGRGGGGCAHCHSHGRSRMGIDRRIIPTMSDDKY